MKWPNRWALVAGMLLLALEGGTTVAQDDANAAAALHNLAAEFQNLGEYQKSADRWNEFVAKYPANQLADRAYCNLGFCQLKLKKYADAVKTLQAGLAKFPNSKEADSLYFNLGNAHYEQAVASNKPEEYKQAATAFADTASKFPQSKFADRARYLQGEALFAAGDVAAAIGAYQQLLKDSPQSSILGDCLYALGTAQQEQAKHVEAAATYQQFLAAKNLADHALAGEVQLRLGLCLRGQKKFAEAEQAFAAAAKRDKFPLADYALLQRGECLAAQDKLDPAAQAYAELLQRFPESNYKSHAQLAIGRAKFQGKKYDEAVQSLTPVADTKAPSAAEANYWLGKSLLALNKPQDAVTRLERAVQGFPQGEFAPYLQLVQADAMFELPTRSAEATALYTALLQKFPEHSIAAQAMYGAALSALRAKDYTQAKTRAEAFLGNAKLANHELLPEVVYIAAEANLLDPQQEEAARRAKAEPLYRRLTEKHPEHPRAGHAQLRIGWCLLTSGKRAEAVNHLNGALGKLSDPERKAEAQLLIGQCHLSDSKAKEAVTALEAALQTAPKWQRADEVLLALAQSQRQVGDAGKAAARADELLKNYAQSGLRADALLLVGEVKLQAKQYDEAIGLFQQIAEKHAGSEALPAAKYGLASALYAKGDDAQALSLLDALVTSSGKPTIVARSQYLRALVRQRRKEFGPAVEDLQAFLATNPATNEAIDARYALALCQVGLGKFAEATAQLDEILKQQADFALADTVYYEMGHALLAQNKPAEASNMFASIAAKFPQSIHAAEAQFRVGSQHLDLAEATKDETVAKEELTKAAMSFQAGLGIVKQAELREKLQYKLGDVLFRQGQYDPAAAVLQQQLKDRPQGELASAAAYLAGESFYRAGKFAEALPLFSQVAASKDERYDANALYRAGTCAAELKNWPESEQRYASVVTLFPKFAQIAEARYGQALALKNQNKLADATAMLTIIAEGPPTETAAKAIFLRGEIKFAEKKFAEAIDDFLLVAVGFNLKSWQALARYEAGRCYLELKQPDKALIQFQTVTKDFPDHPRAPDCAKLIADLKK